MPYFTALLKHSPAWGPGRLAVPRLEGQRAPVQFGRALLLQNEGSTLKVRAVQACDAGGRGRPERYPRRVDVLDQVAEWAARARLGVVFTGAGISTESGIPDFRGPDGFWKRNDQAKFTIQNYVRDPEHRKERWRMAIQGGSFMRAPGAEAAKPNDGHKAIARLEELGIVRGVVTQNVDGLHQEAGSRAVLELHGTTKRIGCLSCGESWPRDEILQRVVDGEEDPACTSCGGILKSATISFGQQLPTDVLEEANEWSLAADFFLVVGSSLVVYPAAALPGVAKQAGAKLAIVNRDDTDQDPLFDAVIQEAAGPTLNGIVERVERLLGQGGPGVSPGRT
jgi:NAD-dependent deacetylase